MRGRSSDDGGQGPGIRTRKGARAMIEARNKLVSLYAEVMDEVAPKETVAAVWVPERRPRVRAAPLAREGAEGQQWPWYELPAQPLLPNVGFEALGAESGAEPVTVVAAFGRSGSDLGEIVRQVSALRPGFGAFRPLYLIDTADTGILRRMGFTFEILSSELYGALEAREAFAARFQYLWRKWSGSVLLDFSVQGYLEARLPDLRAYVDPARPEPRTDGAYREERPQAALPPDRHELRARYAMAGLDKLKDTFVLYRILGNDLPPRHRKGQTEDNLRFLLDHEPDLDGCEKRWLLNRIVDPEQEARLLALLDARGQAYDRIPFDLAEYGETTDWDVESFPGPAFFLRGLYGRLSQAEKDRAQSHARRHKNRYAINNNGARNVALELGRARAKWVLPWDGNCFLTEAAWQSVRARVVAAPYFQYFVVPMARITDNAHLLDDGFAPPALEEPQILFRFDADEAFDPLIHYGRRPKVDLLYRLGVEGPWSTWSRDDVWDGPRPQITAGAGAVSTAGWVARLYSGKAAFEKPGTARERGVARTEAVTAMLDRLDEAYLRSRYDREALLCYDEARVARLSEASPESGDATLLRSLLREADLALERRPGSVAQKTAMPPSGDRQDYYSPAPYWWPNPETPDGLPFVFRDGERNPGAILYAPESDAFDRTRLQRLFDDTTVLALAWRATGEAAYARHAARLVRAWFLDPGTRMTPHLRYAQVKSHAAGEEGTRSGIIEMKDLYFFLDAVRLLDRAGALDAADTQAFRDWLTTYRDWLATSPQGAAERLTSNNHGTCYDLQMLSIAAYLGDTGQIRETLRTSRERLLEQFLPSGEQPHEMKRSMTAHYTAFNLQCWVNLADMAAALGDRLWAFRAADGRGLVAGLRWLFDTVSHGAWPHAQIEPFDRARYAPLLGAARRVSGAGEPAEGAGLSVHPGLCFPHDGIKPFRRLGPAAAVPGAGPIGEGVGTAIDAAEQALSAARIAPSDADPPDPPEIEARAFCGFPERGFDDLKRCLATARRRGEGVSDAARALGRASFLRGEFAAMRGYLGLVTPGPPDEAAKLACARVHALLQEERLAEAQAMLQAALRAHPADVDLHLAALEASGGAFGGDAALDALNTLFRSDDLDEVDRVDGEGGPVLRLARPVPARASEALGRGDLGGSGSGVSVLLPVGASRGRLRQTLDSLTQQSLPPREVILLGRTEGLERGERRGLVGLEGSALRRVDDVPDSPAAALNAGLAVATGALVCVARPGEVWHPQHLLRATAALAPARAGALLPVAAELTDEGRPMPVWGDRLRYASDDESGALFLRSTLVELGGWDDVQSDPTPFLLHRIAAVFGPAALRRLLRTAPTVLRCRASAPGMDPFAHGKGRDELRQMRHALARAGEEPQENRAGVAEPPDTAPAPRGAYAPFVAARPPRKGRRPARFARVFVGDLTASGLMIARVVRAIRADIERPEAEGPFGVFNWPSYANAAASLHEDVADLILAGALYQASAFEIGLSAQTLVLCTPHVVGAPPSGVPDFRPERLEVLCGTALSASEKNAVSDAPFPSADLLKKAFGVAPTWRSLDP